MSNYRHIDTRKSEKPLSGMILEQFGVAHIIGQNLHRFMSADLLQLEDRRPLRRAFGDEARAQRMPTELRRIVSRRGGMPLHQPRDRAVAGKLLDRQDHPSLPRRDFRAA